MANAGARSLLLLNHSLLLNRARMRLPAVFRSAIWKRRFAAVLMSSFWSGEVRRATKAKTGSPRNGKCALANCNGRDRLIQNPATLPRRTVIEALGKVK